MLTREIATIIVKETSLRMNRNINIMDTKGMIIASMDNSRIDCLHEGALEVVKSGQALRIYPEREIMWDGAQPGLNLPIEFNGRIIGVIGITGDPDLMGDIGELVKMTTELMIKQEFMVSQMEWKQRTKETIIEQLLKNTPSYNEIERSLSLLDFKFTPPYVATIIEFNEQSLRKQQFIKQLEEMVGDEKVISGFINLNQLFLAFFGLDVNKIDKKIGIIHNYILKTDLCARISYSLPFQSLDKFHHSYMDCLLALKIGNSNSRLISFAQLEAKALIYQLDEQLTKRFSKRVLKEMDITKADTLRAFFNHNLNIQKTADYLFVHRNTLLYRLNKILEETGYDPRRFKDALVLQVALWIYQKGSEEKKTSLSSF